MSTLVDCEGSVMVYICIQELRNTGMLKDMHIVFCEKCIHYGTVASTEWSPPEEAMGTKYKLGSSKRLLCPKMMIPISVQTSNNCCNFDIKKADEAVATYHPFSCSALMTSQGLICAIGSCQ